jgi:hypothetical protein
MAPKAAALPSTIFLAITLTIGEALVVAKALRERRIILPNEQKQGEYRLPTKSFAVWIKALGAKKEMRASLPQKGEPKP